MKTPNNKSWEDELPQKIIDIVWESTDGGRRLTEHDFYHFEEEIGSMTELKDFISQLLKQERKAERERVLGEVVQMVDKMKSRQICDNGHDCYDIGCKYCEEAVKDELLENVITKLNQLKKE